jgi:tetratricopeptide (TPR) repeat protein
MLLPLTVFSQEENLSQIFSKSYVFESNSEYLKAANIIKDSKAATTYEGYLRMGWCYYLAKDYMLSKSNYEKAVTLMPFAIEPHLGLIYPLSGLGNWEQVLEQYQIILKTDPQNTLALYRVGLIYYNRKDYGNAQKYFEKVVNLYPFDYDSTIMLAWTMFNLNKSIEAKVLFNKCLLMRPDDASATEGIKSIK